MRPSIYLGHALSAVSMVSALCALGGCSLARDDGHEQAGAKQETTRDPAPAQRTPLQWKRYATFEADLARALAFSPENLCLEFGKEPCVRKVHLVPLGGHEPFSTGMLEPPAEPLATTPTVVDRVVLNACTSRAEQDAAGDAKVFKAFPLRGDAPAPGAPEVGVLVTDLYRRLLARNPSAEERDAVASLARDDAGKPIAAIDFAKLACFTIGTTTEFLFF